MSPRNHHIEVAITDRHAYLIEVARRGERSVRPEDRQLALSCQPYCGRGCRLLGDPHADPSLPALGIAGVKFVDCDRSRNVEPQADHALIVAVVLQRLPEAFT